MDGMAISTDQVIGTPMVTECQMDSSLFLFKDNHPFGVSNPQKAVSELLSPSNASDGYNDWDEDGLNNLEEYQVALKFDLVNGLHPSHHLGPKTQTKTACLMVGKQVNTTGQRLNTT